MYQLLPAEVSDTKSKGTKSKGLPDESTSPVWTTDILPLLQITLKQRYWSLLRSCVCDLSLFVSEDEYT